VRKVTQKNGGEWKGGVWEKLCTSYGEVWEFERGAKGKVKKNEK